MYVYACVSVCEYVHMCVSVHLCVSVCVCMCMYVNMCMCVRMCMCVSLCMLMCVFQYACIPVSATAQGGPGTVYTNSYNHFQIAGSGVFSLTDAKKLVVP